MAPAIPHARPTIHSHGEVSAVPRLLPLAGPASGLPPATHVLALGLTVDDMESVDVFVDV